MILRSSKDWPEWRDHIQRAATVARVWEYCDPATEEEDLPVLSKPMRPAISNEDPLDLDEADFKELAAEVSKYQKEHAEYTRKYYDLETINNLIGMSIEGECWNGDNERFFTSTQSPWRKLRCLQELFGRPTLTKIDELDSQWLRLRILADDPAVKQYIHGWESLWKECVNFRIVKPSWKNSRDKILLDSLTGELVSGALQAQPWIEIPSDSKPADDESKRGVDDKEDNEKENDRQAEASNGQWDILSSTDADTNIADERPSLIPSVNKW